MTTREDRSAQDFRRSWLIIMQHVEDNKGLAASISRENVARILG